MSYLQPPRWDLDSLLTVDAFSKLVKQIEESLSVLKENSNLFFLQKLQCFLQETGDLLEEVDMF